jgi:hypothetical protein
VLADSGLAVLIRFLLLIAILVGGLVYGLMLYSRSAHSPNQAPGVTCDATRGCVVTDRSLPGGWPRNPSQSLP